MENADIIDKQSVHRVRAITRRTARRVVFLALLVGVGAGLIMAAVVYALYGPQRLLATWWALAVFPAIGLYQAIHWWRHYRAIFQQLDALEARVERGEVLSGSQVKFHSYR